MTGARLFFLVSFLATGCSHAQQTPEDGPLKRTAVQKTKADAAQSAAFAAVKDGDFAAARGHWREALQSHPEDSYLLSNLGLVEDALGDREAALLHTARATQLHPNSAALAVNHGVVLERNGLGAQAIGQYRRVLDLNPKFEPALMALATRALAATEYAEAERQFKAVLRFHPGHADAYAGLANIAAAKRAWKKAAAFMEKARQRKPRDVIYAAAAGALFYRAGNLNAAKRALDAALNLDPRQGDALVLQSELAWRARDYKAAHSFLQRAVDVDPPGALLAGSLLRQGQLMATLDRPDLARVTLARALGQKRQPPDWRGRAHALLGTLAIRRHDFKKAQREFKAALTLSGETAFVTAGLAAAKHGLALTGPMEQRQESLFDAERMYRRSLDKAENPRIRLSLARLYLEMTDLVAAPYRRGKQRLAEIQIREALRHQPNLVEAHVRLGLLLDTLGRQPEAMASFEEALRLDPDATRVRFLYANLLRREGDRLQNPVLIAAARDAFAHIMRLDSQYVPAQIGWYLTGATAAADATPKAAARQQVQIHPGPEQQLSPDAEQQAPDESTSETIIITPFGSAETEAVPPALEDLLPFLGPGELEEEHVLPEGVIPIKEDDRNPIYSIEGTGPATLTPAVGGAGVEDGGFSPSLRYED